MRSMKDAYQRLGEFSRGGIHKGLKSTIYLKSKIKVLDVKNFVIRLRQNLCLDKMGFLS